MNTPDHCSDDTINRLWEGGPILPAHVPTESLANPETFLGKGYVIDLQRKYAFEFTKCGVDRRPEYHCIDMLTFDPDPDSRWHLTGYGETSGDAQADLLEKIAYAVAHE